MRIPLVPSLALAFGISTAVLAQPTVYFEENFDDNNAGWSLGLQWAIGPAVASPPSNCGFGDPDHDADGPGGSEGIAGIVLGGAAPAMPIHPYYFLECPPIDTAGAPTLYLEFDRWLNSDYTPYMNNIVQVFDGVGYVTLWQSGGFPPLVENEWSHQVFDITPYAHAGLRVRFGYNIQSSAAYENCGSWNLDNVTLSTRPRFYFSDDFDDNSEGWTLETEWQIGSAASSPPGGSCGVGDPGSDADGPGGNEGVAGVVIGGAAATSPLHPYSYLTSPAISTLGATTLYLEFDRWLNSDYTPYMSNAIEVFDGAVWVILWQTGAFPPVQDGAWSHQLFDIAAFGNPALRVRFGFDVASAQALLDCGSWNLDNIIVDDEPQPPPPAAFSRGDGNADGSVDIGDAIHHLAYLFLAGPSTCLDAQDANDDGGVDIGDAIYSLAFQFSGGPTFPPPTLPCGPDPTADALGCDAYGVCP